MVSYAQVSSEIISVVATVLHSNDPRREQKHSDDIALVRVEGGLAAKFSVYFARVSSLRRTVLTNGSRALTYIIQVPFRNI